MEDVVGRFDDGVNALERIAICMENEQTDLRDLVDAIRELADAIKGRD